MNYNTYTHVCKSIFFGQENSNINYLHSYLFILPRAKHLIHTASFHLEPPPSRGPNEAATEGPMVILFLWKL